MLFNSFPFIFAYLPIVLLGCFVAARYYGADTAQFWLIGASLFFYGVWNVAYLPLLVTSICFNYGAAIIMTRQKDHTRRRLILVGAVAVDLCLLAHYKYTGFIVGAMNSMLGTNIRIDPIILPLGISFYTFQQITLLADISSGSSTRLRFRDFFLFVIFFPHLIAGPIVHHREMMPQFQSAKYRFDWENIAVGLSLFVVGLFKKAVLADGIAGNLSVLYRDAATGHTLTLFYAWMAAVGFTLQLYFDFSGYSEMAIGLARMVGIKLPMNFNSPLKAVSTIEFWSRWHITLTRFLTAYIYTPLAIAVTRRRLAKGRNIAIGSRATPGAFTSIVAIPTLITMFFAGLWHGAGYQWIAFGLFHGSYLAINHAWRFARLRLWPDKRSYQRIMTPIGFVLTFCAVAISMPLARANSLPIALSIIGGMFGLHGVALPDAIAHRLPALSGLLGAFGVTFIPAGFTQLLTLSTWIGVLLFIALVPPNVLEMTRRFEPAVNLPPTTNQLRINLMPRWAKWFAWEPTPTWAAVASLATAAGMLALNQVSAFLYWQF